MSYAQDGAMFVIVIMTARLASVRERWSDPASHLYYTFYYYRFREGGGLCLNWIVPPNNSCNCHTLTTLVHPVEVARCWAGLKPIF